MISLDPHIYGVEDEKWDVVQKEDHVRLPDWLFPKTPEQKQKELEEDLARLHRKFVEGEHYQIDPEESEEIGREVLAMVKEEESKRRWK